MKKTIDVLCAGSMSDLYPLRKKIRNILKKQKKIRTFFLEHPGYWKNRENVGLRGREFYTLMEKSKFVLSTTGGYNISVRKHIEAIAARSKILGNSTGFREHKIINTFVTPITQQMSDGQIISTIRNTVREWQWSPQDERYRERLLYKHSPTVTARVLRDKLLHVQEF